MVLLSSLVVACGPKLTPCSGSSCPNISGTYGVDTSTTSGSCDFTPYTLASSITLEQGTDPSQVALGILDQVNQQTLTLTGTIYQPGSKDPASTLGSISLTRQASRLASTGSTTQMDFQITLSASVSKDTKNGTLVLAGNLLTMNLPSTTTTQSCTVTVTFSASEKAP